MTAIPQPGKKAPSFSLPDQNGNKIASKDLKGKWVIFYFYPKDNTPGCTVEAIDFSAKKKDFDKLGAVILGVSPDSAKSHCKFIEGKNLTITLLSDEDHAVIEKYGAWQLKKMMGKEYMGVVRSTWIIDPEGTVSAVWSPVSVKGHIDEVLQKLKELQG